MGVKTVINFGKIQKLNTKEIDPCKIMSTCNRSKSSNLNVPAALAAMAKTPRIHIIDHLTAMTMIQFNGSINF